MSEEGLSKKEKHFKADGHFSKSAGSFVVRFANRKNSERVKLMLEDSLEDTNKYIKPEKASSLSYASRNPERRRTAVLTFNTPYDGNAYKVIIDTLQYLHATEPFSKLPMKIFSSVEEGKWKVVTSPPKEILRLAKYEIDELLTHWNPDHDNEIPVFRSR